MPSQECTAYLKWYYDNEIWKSVRYRGVRTLKAVTDLWNYQEIIAEREIGWVIETGTRHGGSALFFADILEAFDAEGLVLTVDVDRVPNTTPLHYRIRHIIGDSTSSQVIDKLCDILPLKRKPLFVILDSDHSKQHVLKELDAYVPLMQPGDYLVVEDTCLNGHPVRADFGDGPLEAIQEFISKNSEVLFPDNARNEKFGMTFAPQGYYIKA